MDGRVQLPVITYLQSEFGVAYVDVVTEAAPVGVLSEQPESESARSIFRRVQVSIQAHASKGIAIVAHHDCAGNPIPAGEQQRQLQRCLQFLSTRYPKLEILGLWVDETRTVSELVSVRKANKK